MEKEGPHAPATGAGEDAPLVTIGITAWNAEATILRALRSARAQDYPRCEIVVVDDASTDGTPRLLRQALADAPRERLLCNDRNRGVAAARNRLVEEARGDYLCFFDDDDESHPDRVARQIASLEAFRTTAGRETFCACYTDRIQVDAAGRRRRRPALHASAGGAPPRGRAVARMIFAGDLQYALRGSAATCTQMAPLSLYRRLGGFDADMRRCEDTDLNLRLALAGGAFLRIADPLVTQHLTPGADKDGEAEIAGWRHLLAKHRAFLVEEQLWGFARRWLTLRFALWRQQYGRAALAALRLLLRHPFRTGARLGAALRNRSTGWRR